MALQNAPVVAMLPAVDLERAKKFYEEKLGLTPIPMSVMGMAMYKGGAGTMLGLYQREPTKADHTVACFEVPDLLATIRELKNSGVAFEAYSEPDFKTDENNIVTMGAEKAAWFKDTEGNILGLSQKA